jgi:hypothetical protein
LTLGEKIGLILIFCAVAIQSFAVGFIGVIVLLVSGKD